MGANDFEGSDGGPLPKRYVTFTLPKPQWWRPLPDITAHELAQATPILVLMGMRPTNFSAEEAVRNLPPEVARHFSDQRPE